jgi:hypothetical protein
MSRFGNSIFGVSALDISGFFVSGLGISGFDISGVATSMLDAPGLDISFMDVSAGAAVCFAAGSVGFGEGSAVVADPGVSDAAIGAGVGAEAALPSFFIC